MFSKYNCPFYRPTTVFSTGLSDFHKMVVTFSKRSLSKAPLKKYFTEITENSEKDKIKYELRKRIKNESLKCHSEFGKVFVDILRGCLH